MADAPCFTRRFLDIDVLTAARERISKAFDVHERVCVTFSGGKDSGVLLHLTLDEAVKRDRQITVLFLDWEAQFSLTIDFIQECRTLYAKHINFLWVCVPLRTVNACSVFEPEWTCWEPAKADLWVRQPPKGAIHAGAKSLAFKPENALPFYKGTMTFEEFIPLFETWFDGAVLVGLRAAESYDRYLGTFSRLKALDETASTSCPLYDWKTEDVWTYYAQTGKPYNRLYDRMYQAGLSIHRMRICEPYGNEQRQGLWLFQVIEPETWSKVCVRVSGANSGALYAGEKGNVLGNKQVVLPEGHTWQSFALFLLDTMPENTAEHYRSKVAVYLKWYRDHGVQELPEVADGDTGAKDVGSWRRICSTFLRNDFWCIRLGFSPTKAHAYDAYKARIAQHRKDWNIFSPEEA